MALENIRSWSRRSIRFRVQLALIALIVISITVHGLINYIFKDTGYRALISIVLLAVYIFYASRYFAKLACNKVALEIKELTSRAKYISASKSLNNRLMIDSRDDELRIVKIELNSILEKLERAKEKERTFLTNASHELRTPLAVLQGYLNILKNWGMKDESIIKESIESMTEETEHMKIMLENLLFLARSDKDNVKLKKELINLRDIKNKVIKDTSIVGTNRKFYSDIDEDALIEGDTKLVLQLFRSILDNAIKFSKDDSIITINTYNHMNRCLVEIIDQGIGIPNSDKQKIFDRFYRASNGVDNLVEGNGIGLAIAKKIVDIYGGDIMVESELEKGTKITIEFKKIDI